MFYSQFILAKKGPLGTIWIAAHLERKLRKNQVADTDIGVSVDSILFPDVPIALRLSSHLLLGVVRIYSRKVNYLFDDCSEALLKIKQAFRSTAVDLPPEESTAPYHSITLPETFDLDDFELPDNDIFQGNYVDHHVSTREQITLQDTMEGVVYPTSQFGLDERFGDGDTSHVGLDLEEDLFLDKVAAPGLDEVSGSDAQASIDQMAFSKRYASLVTMTGSSEAMPVNGTRNKNEGLVANLEFIEYAQAPSTPGLVEHPNLSGVQEGLASDDHLESKDHNLTELVGIESRENATSKSDLHREDDAMDLPLGNHLSSSTPSCIPVEDNGYISTNFEINQAKLQEDSLAAAVSVEYIPMDGSLNKLDGPDKLEDINNGIVCNKEPIVLSTDQTNGDCKESIGVSLHEPTTVDIANNMEEAYSQGKAIVSNVLCPLELPGAPERITIEAQSHAQAKDPETLDSHVDDEQASSCTGVLRACNSHSGEPGASSQGVNNNVLPSDLQSDDASPCSSETSRGHNERHVSGTSTKVQGEECHMTNGILSAENQILEPTLQGEIQGGSRNADEQLNNAISSNNQSENVNSSVTLDLPAPETLLSVHQMPSDKPDDLLLESTPDKEWGDETGAGTKISGKKRSFTESSITVQSLNSVESFGLTGSKRTADSIPDDDDLLSSILVGRRSSVLKMKPTPLAPEVATLKRARTIGRPSALKRKVLMDDMMVLHGDTIRQQLTNTEDIRRLRKKAPCTRGEIFTIQCQFFEEQIFSELVLTGMSEELRCLLGETFDLNRIRISENDGNNMSSEVAKDRECSTGPIVTQDSAMASTRNDIDGQPVELPAQTMNQQSEDPHLGSYDMNAITEHEPLGEITGMEIDGGNAEVPDVTNHSAIKGFETLQAEPVSGGISDFLTGSIVQSAHVDTAIISDTCLQMDTLDLPSDKMGTQAIEECVFSMDMGNGKKLDSIEVIDHHAHDIDAAGTELRAGEEILLDENKGCASVEAATDVLMDASVPNGDADGSLANVSSETGRCSNQTSVNVVCAPEDTENVNLGVGNDDGGLAMISGRDGMDKTSHLDNEEPKMHSTFLELDGDYKNSSLDGGVYPVCQEIGHQSTMDTEITSFDQLAVGDYGDFQNAAAFGDDTEFLNVDDDEFGEEDDNGLPGAEDARLLDNSGWSSRTRAVAKYLQTIFDEEAGQGRKVLLMDNLLAGKTRKEASRMFFETLVLKTRDYIHVEQVKPFDNIGIKPRARLMKSDF